MRSRNREGCDAEGNGMEMVWREVWKVDSRYLVTKYDYCGQK